jgi:hypothetical protein
MCRGEKWKKQERDRGEINRSTYRQRQGDTAEETEG